MNDPFQLVTNCTFKGKDYLVQMCVLNSKKLELVITDKFLGEDWQCEYDASYIEALTHKTGNFKQFDVFVIMLKSGLLKTSDCISLDLLTIEDLEQLRCKKIFNPNLSSRSGQSANLNKRYLILTYSVEFDRIHYPLPLDYCGPPDPTVLQSNIRRLESEIERLKQKNLHLAQSDIGDTKKLKEKIQNLIEDNKFLTNEVYRLNKQLESGGKSGKTNQILNNVLKKLEEEVLYEKKHNYQLISKLKFENNHLRQKIEDLKKSEHCLKLRIRDGARYNYQRECKTPQRKYKSPENSLDRKRSAPAERQEVQFFCRPVASWNASTMTSRHEIKTIKRSQNRFVSSTSSESEGEKRHRARSREKKPMLCKKQDLPVEKGELCRRSSNERSKHSSDDSKKNFSTQRQKAQIGPKRSSSQEGGNARERVKRDYSQSVGIRSRDSSLSSRGSSNKSRVSRHSNRGSGDYKAPKSARTPRNVLEERADLKFSMSDLETRIHALQKLLKEGLNF